MSYTYYWKVSTRCWLITSLYSFCFLVLPPPPVELFGGLEPEQFNLVHLPIYIPYFYSNESMMFIPKSLPTLCMAWVSQAHSKHEKSLWPSALFDNSLPCPSLLMWICSSLNRPSLFVLLLLPTYVILHRHKIANSGVLWWICWWWVPRLHLLDLIIPRVDKVSIALKEPRARWDMLVSMETHTISWVLVMAA